MSNTFDFSHRQKTGRSGRTVTARRRVLPVCLIFILPFVSIRDTNGQDKVAAYVGEDAISIGRLDLQVELVLTRTKATGDRLKVIKAQVLEENIKQRLVNLYLQQSSYKATDSEIELQLSTLQKELASKNTTLDQYLEKRGISRKQLNSSIAWELAWGKYLDNYLTDNNLQKYFQRHQKRFDGTEIRVAHILLKPTDEKDRAAWKAAHAQAVGLAKSIAEKKITFEDAVIQHSSGATKINKGELGWINWNGPMAAPFTTAAFQLKVGELSPPVQSTFGFHLIKILETKPGKVTLEDIRPQVVSEVKRFLYDWLVDRQLKTTKVKFTGNYPYFEPGTRRLANQ